MNRLSLTLLMSAAGTFAPMTGPAAAKITAFTATCPTDITVKARANGGYVSMARRRRLQFEGELLRGHT